MHSSSIVKSAKTNLFLGEKSEIDTNNIYFTVKSKRRKIRKRQRCLSTTIRIAFTTLALSVVVAKNQRQLRTATNSFGTTTNSTKLNIIPVNASTQRTRRTARRFRVPTVPPTPRPSISPTKRPTLSPTYSPTRPFTPTPTATQSPTTSIVSCPPTNTDQQSITLGSQGRILKLVPSSPGTLCILSKIVTTITTEAKLVEIPTGPKEKDTKRKERKYTIPIARSYEAHSWEWSSVPSFNQIFRQTGNSQIECTEESHNKTKSTTTLCKIELPDISPSEDGKYVLTSYRYTLPIRDEISRFLDRVTFGVNQEMIEKYYGDGGKGWGEDKMVQIVKEQMDLMPMSSHREFWRERANPKWSRSTQPGASDHPCNPNSRWRRYTFIRSDRHDNRGRIQFKTVKPSSKQQNDVLSTKLYQAEDATFLYKIDLKTVAEGFMGMNYLDFDNSNESYVEWSNIQVEVNGTYPLSFRYSQGSRSSGNRPLRIFLDGKVVKESLDFKYTGGFSYWTYSDFVMLPVPLVAGRNYTIRADSISESGGPHLDHLRLGYGEYVGVFINDHVRTVLKGGIRYYQDFTTKVVDANKIYEVCEKPSSPQMRYPRGRLRIREVNENDRNDKRECLEVDIGNPEVNFSGFENLISKNGLYFKLDDEDLKPYGNYLDNSPILENQEYILPKGILNNPSLCKKFPSQAEAGDAPILARLPDQSWLIYTPHLILSPNTPSSPLRDGGGSVQLSTAGRTKCSNVPRNIFNEGSCQLSQVQSTCAASSGTPDVDIDLVGNNLLTIHELTGRFVYAVEGLRLQDVEMEHPCIVQNTRWFKEQNTQCQNETLTLHGDTKNALRFILEGAYDNNDFLVDAAQAYGCHESDYDTTQNPNVILDIEMQIGTTCYKHVHRNYYSIYDFTNWAEEGHPGNFNAEVSGNRHPIKKWAEDKIWKLIYPRSHPANPDLDHPMYRWDELTSMSSTVPEMTMSALPPDDFSKTFAIPQMSDDTTIMSSIAFSTTSVPPTNKNIIYVGRFGDKVSYRDLPDELKVDEVQRHFYGEASMESSSTTSKPSKSVSSGVIVCGSEGEVSNDPTSGGAIFDVESPGYDNTYSDDFHQQKNTVWTKIVLDGKDQLRQRVAWALSQILVVVPGGIEGFDLSEVFLNYYDIFVRNAFGNYLDILRSVSYSPLTAEHLSFLQSKSHAYIYENDNKRIAQADENYSREIMQLFSIGMNKLNLDGTPKLDSQGNIIPTYDNSDIMSFARAWTGFERQGTRGNIEQIDTCSSCNRLDPLKIEPDWRDRFPKSDLNGGFIGDGYPLCVDLPKGMFLRKGAKYRLLGGDGRPELIEDNHNFAKKDMFDIKRLILDPDSSDLFKELSKKAGGKYQPVVTLTQNIKKCSKDECKVDTVRVVQLGGTNPPIYYEYIRPACVEHPFFHGGKKIGRKYLSYHGTICTNTKLPYASEACCSQSSPRDATRNYIYEGERMTYDTALNDRCPDTGLCKYRSIDYVDTWRTGYHWTNEDCSIQVKVNEEGHVAIVHDVFHMEDTLPLQVSEESLNYFKVHWDGGDNEYPSATRNNCGNRECKKLQDGSCLCQMIVEDEAVFSFSEKESFGREDILSSLHVGGVDPEAFDEDTYREDIGNGYLAYVRSEGIYDIETIFKVKDDTNREHYLKNVRSTVRLQGWTNHPLVLEAEDTSVSTHVGCKVGGGINGGYTRYSGDGYVSFDRVTTGSYIEWKINNIPIANDYKLYIRYSRFGGNRPLNVTVNDEVIDSEMDFLSSGSTSYWIYTPPIFIPLRKGTNTIRLTSINRRGPHVDAIRIDGSAINSTFSFRNPVHFMSLISDYYPYGIGETTVRDAQYETEAVLEHLFYHDNVAPFLCTRLIQRFGLSNPSPRYIKECSLAFRNGEYRSSSSKEIFGSGKYGDLKATIASIILDRESTSVTLDADPGHGSIREPLLKVIALMKNLNFQQVTTENKDPLPKLWFLHNRISQAAYEFPSVFSFYLPEYLPDTGPAFAASYVSPEAMLLDMPRTVELLNGIFSMVKYGLSDCYSPGEYGFGHYEGYGYCVDDGKFDRASGVLNYEPPKLTGTNNTTNTMSIIDDLATLMTSGRLSHQNRRIIQQAFDSEPGERSVKIRLAQQLIATSAEFHSTNHVKAKILNGDNKSVTTRDFQPKTFKSGDDEGSTKGKNDGGYKAIVYFFMEGGCDSFNMLVPHTCPQTDLYQKYQQTRENVALLKEDLLEIKLKQKTNSTKHTQPPQPCESFGLHPKLPILQTLYNEESALFIANAGLLSKPVDKTTYKGETPVQLFAHNAMSRESKLLDINDEFQGTGILGRIVDALNKKKLKTGSFSMSGNQAALIGNPGVSPSPSILSDAGLRDFNPGHSDKENDDMMDQIKHLNNVSLSSDDTGFMGEMWSIKLFESLSQHEQLFSADNMPVTTDFPKTKLGSKLRLISQLIQNQKQKRETETDLQGGADRDVFYVSMGGYDAHSDVKNGLNENFEEVNSALEAFVTEMKTLELWSNVTILQFSEFGRTLKPTTKSSRAGTDHGWGGHHFVLGGAVAGGRILGEYPDEFEESVDSKIVLSRGRMVPTTPWDSVWNGVVEWLGVGEEEKDQVLPMRKNFGDGLFREKDLFKD